MTIIRYKKELGNYVENNRLIPRSRIRSLVQNETQELNTQLQRLVRSYQGNSISLLQLQLRSAELIRDKGVALGLLAVGGKEQLNNEPYKQRVYGLMGKEIQNTLRSLQRTIVAVSDGKISDRMLAFKMKQISASVMIHHYAVEKLAREEEGFNFASRKLEPGAKHCKSCPSYKTDGFVPLSQLITPGRLCECGGFCRCFVSYKKDYRNTEPKETLPDEQFFRDQGIDPIGEGANGRVYARENVAYKYPDLIGNISQSEIDISVKAGQLGVGARIFEVRKSDNAYSMEFLQGFESLQRKRNVFQEDPEFGRTINRNFIQQMRVLHENGIMHGDTHDENIMVDRLGRVRIIDYGYSRNDSIYDIAGDIRRISTRYWLQDTADFSRIESLVNRFYDETQADYGGSGWEDRQKLRITRFYDELETYDLTPVKRVVNNDDPWLRFINGSNGSFERIE